MPHFEVPRKLLSRRWQFHSNNALKSFRSFTYRATAGSLLIKSANVSSTGIFQCMARNNYGTLLSKVYVDIKEGMRKFLFHLKIRFLSKDDEIIKESSWAEN